MTTRILAVSYTHLDVYKRQWLFSGEPGDFTRPENRLIGIEAVSYTHLDVYKRQALGFPMINMTSVFCTTSSARFE